MTICNCSVRPAPPPRLPDRRPSVKRGWSTQSELQPARPTSVPLQQKAVTVDNVASGEMAALGGSGHVISVTFGPVSTLPLPQLFHPTFVVRVLHLTAVWMKHDFFLFTEK